MRSLVCIALLVVGLIVLAWPEENNLMMVQFSRLHGPSVLDLVGIAIILAGYVPLIIQVIVRFGSVQQSIGTLTSRYLIAAVVISGVLIAVGLAIENEMLLWTSVAIATIAQGILIYPAVKKPI